MEALTKGIMEHFKGRKIEFINFIFLDSVGRRVETYGFRSGWLIDYEIKPGYEHVKIFLNTCSYFVKPQDIQIFSGWMDQKK